ncbi:MAG: fluoride efflux transporter CrcB [Sphingopyxis sp.]
MPNFFLVMAGGAIGAALRYGASRALPAPDAAGWPWATFGVNVIGGLLMGMLASALARHGASEPWRLFLGVGVLGGFTTFSAFSLESFAMIESGRWAMAGGYAAASVIASVAALSIGMGLVRAL